MLEVNENSQHHDWITKDWTTEGWCNARRGAELRRDRNVIMQNIHLYKMSIQSWTVVVTNRGPPALTLTYYLLCFFFGSPGFELRALCLLSQVLYHWGMLLIPFAFTYFLGRESCFARGWPQTLILQSLSTTFLGLRNVPPCLDCSFWPAGPQTTTFPSQPPKKLGF
jgi:hypothetical protein